MTTTKKTAGKKKAPRCRIGKAYVFFREGHDWHTDTVSILDRVEVRGKEWFIVARCCDVATWALSGAKGAKGPRFRRWRAEAEELM